MMLSSKSPIIVALDDTDIIKLIDLTSALGPYVHSFKLGLEFFSKYGPEGVLKFTERKIPIFLDLKLHDIPNTVAASITQLCELNIDMLTVHLSGGLSMLKAAKEARDKTNKNVKLLGVSVLTSLDDDDLHMIGSRFSSQEQVLNLFNLAGESGIDAVVCSAQEVSLLKDNNVSNLKFITPGIRLDEEIQSNKLSDQKRVVTPQQAVKNGSDYLVIGRSITNHQDPVVICKEIMDSLT
ncbi:MAG: orotidine-5'-phosphate decarboxylase [Rickettsiales bacterium]|jgi:orotidine-5'-phosphate decarboxylase|nr:orotidine-5'-phosphate decarboxylase [Rickettsiales bacterium]